MNMLDIQEIEVGWGNTLYLIAYTDWCGQNGLDYTTNLIELKELLEYHEKHDSSFQVFKVVTTKKGETK